MSAWESVEGPGLAQDLGPGLEDPAPGVGERGSVAGAIEDGDPQAFFEGSHGVADRRRHPVKGSGSGGK